MTKKTKFSDNLNFWRQNSDLGSGDLAGQLSNPMWNLEWNKGPGGKYMKTEEAPNNQNCYCLGRRRLSVHCYIL